MMFLKPYLLPITFMLWQKEKSREGTPEELQKYASPFVKQFLTGSAEGPVEYQFSHQAYLDNEVRP